ncbi:MAG: response regulator [Micromonosporaceae bacterium]
MPDLVTDLPPERGELLVADDEPFLRDAVAASLRFLGFEVTTAQTGGEVLRLARGRPFDLVVLDVMLPDADGFDVVRRLRGEGCQCRVVPAGRPQLSPRAARHPPPCPHGTGPAPPSPWVRKTAPPNLAWTVDERGHAARLRRHLRETRSGYCATPRSRLVEGFQTAAAR